MHPSKTETPIGFCEREAEIPSLLSIQQEHLEGHQMLIDRLYSKLVSVMIPSAPTKEGADVASPPLTSLGNLIDRTNQEIVATNHRLQEMLDRLAL